jgi:hypothetical protein
MSESVRYRWSLQAQMRRQAYLERVRGTTARYYDRHVTLLSDLSTQGLERYLPEEFERVRSIMNEVRSILESDPERARAMSLQIGQQLSALTAMARSARREFETRERLRQQELSEMRRRATSELAQFLQSLITEIQDPIEQDFAFDKLKAIQSNYVGRIVEATELPKIKEELRRKVFAIHTEAAEHAKAWKQRKSQETILDAQKTLIEIHREQAVADGERNPKAVQSMLATLDSMHQSMMERGCSLEEIQKGIAEATENTDAAVADENCRRMVVRAILDSLEKAGFVVAAPQRQVGDKDEVVIMASKPAGAEASFRVTADGNMLYKFDHYEGMKCKTDIDRVLPMLQEIYGVKLSDERVLWQNPDRISKSAKPLDDGHKEQGHGQE